MIDGLKNCGRCGQLFAPPIAVAGAGPAREFCESCLITKNENSNLIEESIQTRGLKKIADISDATGILRGEVGEIVRSSHFLSNATDPQGLCSMCQTLRVQPGSRFCLRCRLEMHASLSSTAKEIASTHSNNFGYLPEEPDEPMSVGETIQAKRRRTGSHRFGDIPQPVKKY